MIIIFVISAFILAWFFIEITLFLVNKNYTDLNNPNRITYIKFIWSLRILAILLFFFTGTYMYYFENTKFLEAVEYCLGVIK